MIFLDANVLVYYLDDSSSYFAEVIDKMQKLEDEQIQLVTSHHVIEEVLYIVSRLFSPQGLTKIVDRIGEIPGLILVEPLPNLSFAKDYADLSSKYGLGINDALLVQLMLDAGIKDVFSYDKKLVDKAKALGINSI